MSGRRYYCRECWPNPPLGDHCAAGTCDGCGRFREWMAETEFDVLPVARPVFRCFGTFRGVPLLENPDPHAPPLATWSVDLLGPYTIAVDEATRPYVVPHPTMRDLYPTGP